MKCPNCGYSRIPYNIRRPKDKNWIREDYKATCPKCKWEGEVYFE